MKSSVPAVSSTYRRGVTFNGVAENTQVLHFGVIGNVRDLRLHSFLRHEHRIDTHFGHRREEDVALSAEGPGRLIIDSTLERNDDAASGVRAALSAGLERHAQYKSEHESEALHQHTLSFWLTYTSSRTESPTAEFEGNAAV